MPRALPSRPFCSTGCTRRFGRRRFLQAVAAAAAAVTAAPMLANARALETSTTAAGWTAQEIEPVDLIVRAGYVLTMDTSGAIYAPGAVAIRGAEIVAVGPAPEIAGGYYGARVIDVPQGIVMPGLIDGHTHLPMTLFRGIADDLPLDVWLQQHIWPAEGRFLSEDTVRWGTQLAIAELIQSGVTTVADMYFYEDVIATALQEAGMRGIVAQAFLDSPTPQGLDVEGSFAYTERLLERWYGDDLIVPAIGPHAPYTVSPDLYRRVHNYAARRGIQVVTHLAETRTEVDTIQERYGTTPVRHLDRVGVLDARLIAAHCVWPDAEEIALLADREVGVVHNPRSNLKLASGIAPVPEMLAAGVRLGLGTDGAASNNRLDLVAELQTAALIHKGATGDPTVVSAEDVLRMATIGGARALHMEDRIGSLEPGKRADLIVLDVDRDHLVPLYDPMSHVAYAARGSDVGTVIVNGRVLLEDGELLTIDDAEAREQVRRISERIASGALAGS